MLVGQGVIIDLLPIFFVDIVAVILGALGDKEVEMGELLWGGLGEPVDNLDEELVKFLTGNGANLEVIEALHEKIGDVVGDRGLGDV